MMDDGTTENTEQVPQRVSGSTLLMIGYGRIGRMLARKALVLGMKVLAYDPYVKEAEGTDLVSSLDEGLRRLNFSWWALTRGFVERLF